MVGDVGYKQYAIPVNYTVCCINLTVTFLIYQRVITWRCLFMVYICIYTFATVEHCNAAITHSYTYIYIYIVIYMANYRAANYTSPYLAGFCTNIISLPQYQELADTHEQSNGSHFSGHQWKLLLNETKKTTV